VRAEQQCALNLQRGGPLPLRRREHRILILLLVKRGSSLSFQLGLGITPFSRRGGAGGAAGIRRC